MFQSTYRNPWTEKESLPPVDLQQVLLQVDAYGRPLHRVSEMRQLLGLPTINPGLERQLKEHGFWPQEAKPLPFDIADVIWRCSRLERAVVYGTLMGLSGVQISRQMGVAGGNVSVAIRSITQKWYVLAKCLGVVPLSPEENQADPIHIKDVTKALGYHGYDKSTAMSMFYKAGCNWYNPRHGVGGLKREEFFKLYAASPRWDDIPHRWVPELKRSLTYQEYDEWLKNKANGVAS